MKRKKDINFDLTQLRSFCTVVEEQSFTKASRILGVGQATISHHIMQLEKNLGVPLIRRSSKQFSVTREGDLLKEYSEMLFQHLDEMRAEFNSDTVTGVTRLASSTVPSTYILPEIIPRVREKVPNALFSIQVSDSREVIEKVKERIVDAGIAGRIMKHPSLVYHRVFSDEIVLISPVDKFPDSIGLQDLPSLPFITREKGSGTREAYERVLQKHNISNSSFNFVLECSTSESVKEAVLSGMGVGFISKLAIRKELELKQVRVIQIRGLSIKRDFFLLYQRSKPVTRSIEALLDEFRRIK